eukprot:3247000-Rhodomonas_salina.2
MPTLPPILLPSPVLISPSILTCATYYQINGASYYACESRVLLPHVFSVPDTAKHGPRTITALACAGAMRCAVLKGRVWWYQSTNVCTVVCSTGVRGYWGTRVLCEVCTVVCSMGVSGIWGYTSTEVCSMGVPESFLNGEPMSIFAASGPFTTGCAYDPSLPHETPKIQHINRTKHTHTTTPTQQRVS